MSNRSHRSRRNAKAKQERAAQLRAEAATRTPEQQIAHLDENLGEGQGAVKERARLAEAMAPAAA